MTHSKTKNICSQLVAGVVSIFVEFFPQVNSSLQDLIRSIYYFVTWLYRQVNGPLFSPLFFTTEHMSSKDISLFLAIGKCSSVLYSY